jgi:hypothetical protein
MDDDPVTTVTPAAAVVDNNPLCEQHYAPQAKPIMVGPKICSSKANQ